MPNIKSAKKRVKIIEKKTLRNNMIKSGYKSAVKKFENAVAAGKIDEAKSYIEKGRDNRNDYYNSVSTMNTAIESALMTTKGLDALYADYQKKIDAYNDAVIADDTSLIQETYSNLQNSYNNLLSNIKGDIGVISQDSIKNWIKDTQHKIDLVADDTPLILDIKASLDEEGTSEETVGGFVHIVSTNKNAVQEIAKVIKDNQYTYEDLSEVASIAAKNASDLDDTKRDIYKSMSDKQKEVYDALNTYVTDVWNSGAEEAGRTKISIDELINALLKLGVVERKTVQQFSKFSLSDYKEDLDSLNKDISTLQSAYTKSISGELTDEDKLKLITDKDNGFPDDYGMLECNVIVTDLTCENARGIFEMWWDEVLQSGSGRDQLALPYVLWSKGIRIDEIAKLGSNCYRNYKIQFADHL